VKTRKERSRTGSIKTFVVVKDAYLQDAAAPKK
jgi:hypothetical protein